MEEELLMINTVKRIHYSLSNWVQNYTQDIWFPLTIVCLNGIIHILNIEYIRAFVKYPDIPQNIQIAISIVGGFSIVVSNFINWFLITVIIFFWCELFYDINSIFRNFFEIVGICHLILLITTLSCSIFILFNSPENPQILEFKVPNVQETTTVITDMLNPLKRIQIMGRICFGFILILVVQAFFQIRWFKAVMSVGIPYTIYWMLSSALQSVFQFN